MLSARPPPQIRQLFAALLEQTQLSKASDRELLRKLFRLQVKEQAGGVEKTGYFWRVALKVTSGTVFNDNRSWKDRFDQDFIHQGEGGVFGWKRTLSLPPMDSLPVYLHVNLDRQAENEISIPETWDLSGYVPGATAGQANYDLVAVLANDASIYIRQDLQTTTYTRIEADGTVHAATACLTTLAKEGLDFVFRKRAAASLGLDEWAGRVRVQLDAMKAVKTARDATEKTRIEGSTKRATRRRTRKPTTTTGTTGDGTSAGARHSDCSDDESDDDGDEEDEESTSMWLILVFVFPPVGLVIGGLAWYYFYVFRRHDSSPPFQSPA